jgi:hypothetical protein
MNGDCQFEDVTESITYSTTVAGSKGLSNNSVAQHEILQELAACGGAVRPGMGPLLDQLQNAQGTVQRMPQRVLPEAVCY